MASPQNHWKLGLFIVVGLVLALATVALLGARSMHREVVLYTSYFDESVQGLEVGSPIKFRGVTIGTVGKIQVAPDHRLVEVESELEVDALARLGLDIASGPRDLDAIPKLEMSADLRLQLASSGLTGMKFLQLDFFDITAYPHPVLPFDAPANYIPTAPSMLKNLDDSATRMMNSLPEITEQIAESLGMINEIIQDVGHRDFPKQATEALEVANGLLFVAQQKLEELDAERLVVRVTQTLDSADGLLLVAQQKLEEVDAEGLSNRAKTALDTADGLMASAKQKLEQVDAKAISNRATHLLSEVTAAVNRLDELLVRVGKDGGLLASVQRTSNALGDSIRDADGLGGELVETLKSVQSAVRSLRNLTEALGADPDMLLKGRSPEEEQ